MLAGCRRENPVPWEFSASVHLFHLFWLEFPSPFPPLISSKYPHGLCPVRVENGAKVHQCSPGSFILHPPPSPHLGTPGADPFSVLLEPQAERCPQHSLGASWVGPPAQFPFLVARSSNVKKAWGLEQGTPEEALSCAPRVPLHTAHHHFAHCLFTLHVSKAERMENKVYLHSPKGC